MSSDHAHFRSVVYEETTLFVSLVKWTSLAVVIGAIVGALTKAFVWVLVATHSVMLHWFHNYYYFGLVIGLPLSVWVVKRFATTGRGEGTEQVIRAVHVENGRVDNRSMNMDLIATILTLLFGGSVGKEGPAAQIGAEVASMTADALHVGTNDRRRIVICGVSAGFAAVFGTPISGAVFGVEVLYLGSLEYDVFFPCIVAGVVAHLVCGNQAPVTPSMLMNYHLGTSLVVALSLGSGIFFGLVALLMCELQRLAKHFVAPLKSRPFLLAAVGGAVLTLYFLVVGDGYAWLGLAGIDAAVAGRHVSILAFLYKMVATVATFAVGGCGGIVTPIFFIGANAGSTFAQLTHSPEGLMAALGMVAVLSAATNTPIAGAIMALELFGMHYGADAALCCATAYLVAGHRSVLPSQVLGMSKTPSIEIPANVEAGDIETVRIHARPHSLLSFLLLQRRHRSEHHHHHHQIKP